MTRRGWTIWVCACLAWTYVIPLVFGVWLAAEVDAQYTSSARTSTDGDSISLPIAGIAVLNLALVVTANFALGVYMLIRRYLKRDSSRPPSASVEH
jgi:hypothetical protein